MFRSSPAEPVGWPRAGSDGLSALRIDTRSGGGRGEGLLESSAGASHAIAWEAGAAHKPGGLPADEAVVSGGVVPVGTAPKISVVNFQK